MLIKYYLHALMMLLTLGAMSQRGSFGNQTINAQDTWGNMYTHLTNNAAVGITTITVDDASVTGLQASGAGTLTYQWTPSGQTTIDLEDVVARNYALEVTDENGCTETAGSFTVEVIPSTTIDSSNVNITQVICEVNDRSIINRTMNLQIFNRWGELIFESNEPSDCCNDSFRDEIVNTGTYIYKLSGTRDDGTNFEKAVNVNVVR